MQRSGPFLRDLVLPERRFATLVAATLIYLLLFAGSGNPSPFAETLAELIVLPLFVAAIWRLASRPVATPWLLPPVLILAAAVLVPLVQLIPLPFGVWSELPGRGPAVSALQLAGLGQPAAPLSLDPFATTRAALSLLVPISIFLGVYALEPRDRRNLLLIVALVASLSALLGIVQALNPGQRWLYLWPKAIFTSASGLLANRNHQADFLIAGLLCLSYWLAQKGSGRAAKPWYRQPLVALLPVIILGLAVCGSRAGYALALVALAYAAGGLFKRPALQIWVLRLFVAALVLAALVALFDPFGARGAIGSLLSGRETRVDALPDLLFALQSYYPVGSGLGTFDAVFRGVESLDLVSNVYLNRAHNEYIEVLIEAGLPGILVMAAVLIWLLIRWWQVGTVRDTSPYRALQRLAAIMLFVFAAHSVVDYPLRSLSLAALAGLFAAILTPDPRADAALVRRRTWGRLS